MRQSRQFSPAILARLAMPSFLLARRTARTDALRRAAAETSRPLDEAVRRPLAHRVDRDFSHVRVHAGPESDQAARAFHARAYTLGRDIHLSREARQLSTRELHRLLSHEAVHSVQQGGVAASPSRSTRVSDPTGPAEREAR